MTDTVPEYLNVDLFQNALNNFYGFNRNIKDINFKLISGNGDNYCSNVYRATIKLEDDDKNQNVTLTVIVKDLLKEITDLHLKELDMYTKVLKELNAIIKTTVNTDLEDIKFAPDCLLATRTHGELYLFEDLNAMGYKIASRWHGLNEQQCLLTLKKLAQFHAASMVLADKCPSIIDLIRDSHLKNGPADIATDFIYGNMEAAVKYLETLPDYQCMAVKVQENLSNFSKKIQATVSTEQCLFKVINHADLWLNNILIKETADGAVEDAVFLDFQLSFYGSPGIDLNFFLHTSVPLELLQTKRYEFLRFYYKHLSLTLACLKYTKIPHFMELMQEVRRTEFYSFYAVTSELPLMCLSTEQSKTMSVSAFSNADIMQNMRTVLFSNERVRATLIYTLDRLNELGVLD